ncbi:MAG: hypothetical protein SF162_03740 [bacterium]|nr:hypothetical protein [bacterium]
MAWRVYLSERPIRRIDLLPGKPSVLAAWLTSDQIMFLDLQTGSKRGEKLLEKPTQPVDRFSEGWRSLARQLTASNGVFLPLVRTAGLTVYSSPDGEMRLYRTGAVELFFEVGGREHPLPIEPGVTDFAAVDMDRAFGLVAALDMQGSLHLYQQHLKIGTFGTGMPLHPELRADIAVAGGGTSIFVTNGRQIGVFGASGTMRQVMEPHYTLGTMRPSADGKLLVTTDLDANVIRFYNGETLAPTHQRFGVDLMADARRLQIMPGPAAPTGALGAVALNTRGVLAFTMGGGVCVTNLARFKPLPGIAPTLEEESEPAPPSGLTLSPADPSTAQNAETASNS